MASALKILLHIVINLPALIQLIREIVRLLDEHLPKSEHKSALNEIKDAAQNLIKQRSDK